MGTFWRGRRWTWEVEETPLEVEGTPIISVAEEGKATSEIEEANVRRDLRRK